MLYCIPVKCTKFGKKWVYNHNFCKCFDIVVADEMCVPRQEDVLKILDPWKKVVMIDEVELVSKYE